jgi:hypothetical protein
MANGERPVVMGDHERFYTYLWLRENGTPYYVGKGLARRVVERHKIRGVWCKPPLLERTIIQKFDSEKDALLAEQLLIAYYGRKDNGTGVLLNLTDGGVGGATSLGRKASAETRKKMSQAAMGNTRGRSKKGKKYGSPSDETRMKMSLAQKRRGKPSDEAKRNRSIAWIRRNAARHGMSVDAYLLRIQNEKWCNGCNNWHPKTEFSPALQGRTFQGLVSFCRTYRNSCARQRTRKLAANRIPTIPPQCERGEKNKRAKLRDADVLVIRRQVTEGVTQSSLAVEYGISPSLVNAIILGRKWTHGSDVGRF